MSTPKFTAAMNRQLSVAVLLGIAGLSMGNTGCEDQSTGRILKLDGNISQMMARKVTMPNGEVVDFPYVANVLLYREVLKHSHFVISNPVPTPQGTEAPILASVPALTTASTKGSGVARKGDLVASTLPSSGANSTAATGGTAVDAFATKDLQVLAKFGFIKKSKSNTSGAVGSQKQTLLGKITQFLTQAAATPTPAPTGTGAWVSEPSEIPACLYNLPQTIVSGEVIGFEATWGVGVGIGYSPTGGLGGISGVGGNFNFSEAQLDLGLRVDDPLSQQTLAVGDGVAEKSAGSFGFGFSFLPGASVGLDFFFNTPIADVIRSAMTEGLDNVSTAYANTVSPKKDWNDAWESRVIYDPQVVSGSTFVAFRSGFLAGVQIGDKFSFTNLRYDWEGEACKSRLKYRVPLSSVPAAEGEIVSVGDNVSVAKVTRYVIENSILPGAMVKLLAFKPEPKSGSGATSKTP